MKKSRFRGQEIWKCLISLAFLALLSCPAKAGVPCSVPFNLTNGTVADATQVMANYNAILSCLSTSAAAAGSNNDITALNALSPPITTRCGATGFTAVNDTGTPLTQLDLKYTEAMVVNSSGSGQRGVSGSLVLNFGTVGAANGLDAGSLAASTNYYLYLIGNGSIIASLASASSTAPVLPATYTFSCRVGAWYSTTLSQLVTGRIGGNKFMLGQKPGGAGSNIAAGALQTAFGGAAIGTCGNFSTDTMVLTTYSGIPATAIEAIGNIGVTGNSAFVSNVGPSVNIANEIGSASSVNSIIQFDLVIPSPEAIYICTGGGGANINIIGWVDSANAH